MKKATLSFLFFFFFLRKMNQTGKSDVQQQQWTNVAWQQHLSRREPRPKTSTSCNAVEKNDDDKEINAGYESN